MYTIEISEETLRQLLNYKHGNGQWTVSTSIDEILQQLLDMPELVERYQHLVSRINDYHQQIFHPTLDTPEQVDTYLKSKPMPDTALDQIVMHCLAVSASETR